MAVYLLSLLVTQVARICDLEPVLEPINLVVLLVEINLDLKQNVSACMQTRQ